MPQPDCDSPPSCPSPEPSPEPPPPPAQEAVPPLRRLLSPMPLCAPLLTELRSLGSAVSRVARTIFLGGGVMCPRCGTDHLPRWGKWGCGGA